MPVGDGAGQYFLRPEAVGRESFEIPAHQLGTCRIHLVEMHELDSQDGCLQVVEPAVGTRQVANILVTHAVIAQHPQLACDCRVAAYDRTAVAVTTEVFGWVEAE